MRITYMKSDDDADDADGATGACCIRMEVGDAILIGA